METNSGQYPILETGTVKNWEQKLKNIGRPTIFVGSSVESKPIAEKLRACFPVNEFEVDIWYDGVFGATSSSGGTMSNMEWLKGFTDIYDFAIFIFVPEDTIVSATRKDLEDKAPRTAQVTRHNVVFEFGMFLGRVGAKRSFILFDDKVKEFIDLFFTDLKENLDNKERKIEINDKFRLELYEYQGNYQRYIESGHKEAPFDEASIEAAIEKIKLQIKQNFESIDIGFLPAVTLAFGYYNNFISTFVRNVNILKSDEVFPEAFSNQEVSTEDLKNFRHIIQQSDAVKLKIVIPTSIEGSLQANFIPDLDKKKFQQIKFPGSYRPITLLRLAGEGLVSGKEWIIYDLPTTLNSSIEAIDMVTQHPQIRELLKEKELRNFKKSLEYKFEIGGKVKGTENVADLVELITYGEFLQVIGRTEDYIQNHVKN